MLPLLPLVFNASFRMTLEATPSRVPGSAGAIVGRMIKVAGFESNFKVSSRDAAGAGDAGGGGPINFPLGAACGRRSSVVVLCALSICLHRAQARAESG